MLVPYVSTSLYTRKTAVSQSVALMEYGIETLLKRYALLMEDKVMLFGALQIMGETAPFIIMLLDFGKDQTDFGLFKSTTLQLSIAKVSLRNSL